MPKVHAVLLVPAEGDPLGLLREGPCGARPPMVTLMHCARCGRRWWEPRPAIFDPSCQQCGGRAGFEVTGLARRALVLAWDSQPVNHAAAWLTPAATCGWLGYLIDLIMPGEWENKEECRALAIKHFSRFGALILLDADSREIGGDR